MINLMHRDNIGIELIHYGGMPLRENADRTRRISFCINIKIQKSTSHKIYIFYFIALVYEVHFAFLYRYSDGNM